MDGAPGNLTIQPLAGRIGAEILGVDTARPLSDETVAAIRAALLKHQVVFLREQELDYDSQVSLASRFGTVTPGHPIFAAPEGKPFLREFDSRSGIRANHWHSDLTFLPNPPSYAFLRNVVIPAAGGDTMWSSGMAAYESLPASLKDFAAQLRIVHSNDSDYIDATIGAAKAAYVATLYEAEHSAVQRHPESDRPFLLVGGFAKRVVGYDPKASRAILGVLQHFAELPENTLRWRWQPRDLAIWDNLATQHYAIYDYGNGYRRNERVTVMGGDTVGLDGRLSVALAPRPNEERSKPEPKP